MDEKEIRIPAPDLQGFTDAVFQHVGLTAEDAAIEAEVLVWANLRGVDSHGVQRIPSYLDQIDAGRMNPRPHVKTLKETPAVLFLDAEYGMGPPVTVYAMDQAIQKARNVGIGWALLRNNTHQGAMAYYAMRAARENMLGIAIVCSPPNMAPFGAKAAGLHNSPIAIAVPAGKHGHVVLDMATSIAAFGKLSVAMDKGAPIPDTWAMDAQGRPTTDPGLARILQPAGGPKGSGLALMFQCITSLMAGNPLLVPVLKGAENRRMQNSVVAAVDIGLFTDVEGYKSNLDELVDCLKSLPRAEGCAEILMPGEPEERTFADRSRNGIPLPPGTVEKLRDASRRTTVPCPV